MRGQARDYDTVAADGQSRLGLGRRAALLQEAPGPVGAGARRLRAAFDAARARRRMAHRAAAHPLGHPGRLPRRGRRGRHPQGRRLQPRRQRGLRLLPRQPEDRRALEHVQGLPAARARIGAISTSKRTRMVERLLLDGKRVTGLVHAPARPASARIARGARGHPGGWRHRLARRSCSCRASAPARCCSRSASRCATS